MENGHLLRVFPMKMVIFSNKNLWNSMLMLNYQRVIESRTSVVQIFCSKTRPKIQRNCSGKTTSTVWNTLFGMVWAMKEILHNFPSHEIFCSFPRYMYQRRRRSTGVIHSNPIPHGLLQVLWVLFLHKKGREKKSPRLPWGWRLCFSWLV